MITLRAHNVFDYAIGALLIACPWALGFAEVGAARETFLALGACMLVYSLFTNYRFALARLIPLGAHMTMDAMVGVLLILAPSMFAYRWLLTPGQYGAHIVLGVGALGFVALTHPRTEHEKSPAERAAISHEPAPFSHL